MSVIAIFRQLNNQTSDIAGLSAGTVTCNSIGIQDYSEGYRSKTDDELLCGLRVATHD